MAHYPANRSSLSFACSILALLTKDCMNRVISSLSMRGMLPKYNFQPRPNSRALTTAGSVMTIGLSITGCSHSKKNSLTRENKFDYFRRLGWGDFKGLKWFRESLLFSSSHKETKGGSDRSQGGGPLTPAHGLTSTLHMRSGSSSHGQLFFPY